MAATPRFKRHVSPTRAPAVRVTLSGSKSNHRAALQQKDREGALREKTENFIRMMKKIPQLRPLPKEKLITLMKTVQEKTFRRGETVIKQGHVGKKMYIIVSGEYNVIIEGKQKDDYVVVRTLTSGSYFGEYSLINAETRSATVVTVEAGVCFVISRTAFNSLYPIDVIRRGRSDLESKKVFETNSVFKYMSPLLLQQLRNIMRPAIYTQNEMIVKAGDLKSCMWFIIEGNIISINADTFHLY